MLSFSLKIKLSKFSFVPIWAKKLQSDNITNKIFFLYLEDGFRLYGTIFFRQLPDKQNMLKSVEACKNESAQLLTLIEGTQHYDDAKMYFLKNKPCKFNLYF